MLYYYTSDLNVRVGTAGNGSELFTICELGNVGGLSNLFTICEHGTLGGPAPRARLSLRRFFLLRVYGVET